MKTTEICAQSAQEQLISSVDLDVEQGQILVTLPGNIDIARIKQIFWRMGYTLAKSKDKDVQFIGDLLEKRLGLCKVSNGSIV
jgi:predicted transglutaminase-like protease